MDQSNASSPAEETFELVALPGGGRSLRSLGNRQTFHPVVGPTAEALAVHVNGTRLVERANAAVTGDAQPAREFVAWDVGLGAAANALTAIAALQAGYTGEADIRLLSFDRTAAAMDFAVANAAALDYAAERRQWLETLRANGELTIPLRADSAPTGPRLHWRFIQGDFPARLASGDPLPAPNAVFFDPYSPAVNPEMWTLDLFASLYARLQPGAPCLLSTYTRSTAVRATLLLAGFRVGFGPATGEKDQTTVAANDLALLHNPLNLRWLRRAEHSTNAAPLRAPIYTQGPISDADFARLQRILQAQA